MYAEEMGGKPTKKAELSWLDESTATTSREKMERLADLFTSKMTVSDSRRPPPQLEPECGQLVTIVKVTRGQVERILGGTDIRKTIGPDNVNPHVLKHWANEVSRPLSKVFKACLEKNTWPFVWKKSLRGVRQQEGLQG